MNSLSIRLLSVILFLNLPFMAMAQISNACLKNYEAPKSLAQMFEDKSGKQNFNFLPLEISEFLTGKYDEVFQQFETQLERLRQVGDKNVLNSAMSTMKISLDKNQAALTKIQKHLNPSSFSISKLSSVEKRSEQLEKLISESNQCKLQTNNCTENLKVAMKESDQNITAIRSLIASLNKFKEETQEFKNYIATEKSRVTSADDIEYALLAVENKIIQVGGAIEVAESVMTVNKKNLLSASLLLDESYLVNQRTKEVRAEGAYSLTDDGSSAQVSQAKPSQSKIKTLLNDLNVSRKKAIQNAKSKLLMYSAPIVVSTVLGTAGVAGYTNWDKIQDYRAKVKVEEQQKEKASQMAIEAENKRRDMTLASLDQMSPGFSAAVKAAAMIPSYDQRNASLLNVGRKYMDKMSFEQVQIIANLMTSRDFKDAILREFSDTKSSSGN